MTRKATKRTHYALINTVEHAKYQASKLSVAEHNTQIAPVITAVEQLSMGHWEPLVDWQPVFEAVNRIESIIRLKRIDDGGFIVRAQGMFVDALSRQKKTGAKAFKAEELATLREIVSVYSDLLGEISRRDFQAACNHTNANVDRIVRQKGKNTISVGHCVIERKGATA